MTPLTVTKRTVEALALAARPFIAWDDRLTGFGVRVQPSGAKTFVVNYRAGEGGRKAQSNEELEREKIDKAVFQFIAEKGEASPLEVSKELKLTEAEVRSSVDRLCKKGEIKVVSSKEVCATG